MKTQKLTGVLLVCWISRWATVRAATSRRYSQPSQTSTPTSFVERDSRLTTPQLIAAYGYPVETHRVRTQDGYLLTLHRIPPRPSASARARARSPGRRAQRAPGQGRAVLLQHGVFCSSADWVVMGPGKALAYLLSDAGYDVWLGNARGNRYSKGHEKALPKQRYWSFSFHEMGVYDLPAVIDFILQKTGHRQLQYVGHSMGTTMFYVMASERPEYNAKVRLMVGLAPVAFLSHMKTGFLRFLASIGDQLGWFLIRAGFDEFQPSDQMRELARSALCTENALSSELCVLLYVLGGFDSTQLNRTMLPVIAAHTPAGTSTKVLRHYAQVAKSGRFQQMDLGAKENSARYGRALPPEYSLGRVTAPVALYTGDNDNLCGPEPELITKYGYPVEQHEVTTEDGYILTVFRIPYGKTSTTKTANRKPVYVQHGLLSSSDDWILARPERALGYILADAGYDVWLTNARGNKWSRRHVSLNPEKSAFWDFSWHEMGVYDLPAVIDHILAVTGQEQLHYIGHSMGTTMFYVMGAMRPEYNAKILSAHTLAPVAYMGNTQTPLLKEIASGADGLGVLLKLLGVNEFLPHADVYGVMGDRLCSDNAPTQSVCSNALFLICGFDSEELNTTMLPLIMSHDPSGSSVKNLLHYAQNIKSGKFQLYDYGPVKNLAKYGSLKAPSYDLSKLTAPVALHYADNDIMAVPEDVQKLQRELPNLIGKFRVSFSKFNHLDFLFAIHAKEYVYDLVIRLMDRY